MTAWSSVAGAVEAMRRGARDYIEKPWDDERLLVTVRTQVELRRALRRSQRLQEANTRLQRGATPTFIGESPAMRQVRQTIERVAPSDAAVLITGEHGTGKEVVATWLHALSERRAEAARDDERRRAGGGDCRERAVRPRQGRVHRRALRSHRLLRARRRRHAVPRRDRQHAGAAAGQAAARAADRRGAAGRLVAAAVRQRARAVGDQRRPAGRDRRRPLPRGPALPAEHRGDPPAAAARAARGHRARWPTHFLAHYAARYRKPLAGFDDRRAGRWRRTAGPATSASWRTRSSARC